MSLPRLLSALVMTTSLFAACDKGPTKTESSAPVATASAAMPTPTEQPKPTPTEQPKATEQPKEAAPTGQSFGAGVTATETVAIDAIIADPAAYKGKTVRVEGMVTDVCPKRGCWFEMAGSAPGQKLRFKVTDGEMVFPVDAKGKHAVAQGEVAVNELTLEESKQHAEYQAKEYGIAYDPASITKPTTIVRIDGTGAVFRDKK